MSTRKPSGQPAKQSADSLDEQVSNSLSALSRIARAAAKAGANSDDIFEARKLFFLWHVEQARRKELERLADIGRKVSSGRANEDRREEFERNVQVILCALRLLHEGDKPRGLAAKIKKEMKLDISDRQINRILHRWGPILLSD